MQDTILSISGKPGLFRLVSQGRNMLIVESLDEAKKRFPVGARDRVTSLNDISMYTDDEDVPLMQVFQNLSEANNGAAVNLHHSKATDKELADFMATALPNYDRDRVYKADMKKLLQWYNILVACGYTRFVEEEETTEAE